jgi:hypothetical protein
MVDTTIRVIDQKGKIIGELQKIFKDVTVEELKKILVKSPSFGKQRLSMISIFMQSLTSIEGMNFTYLLYLFLSIIGRNTYFDITN